MGIITPELAAQVVKNYLLPMFESDEKKYLRRKYKKMSDKPIDSGKDEDSNEQKETPSDINEDLHVEDGKTFSASLKAYFDLFIHLCTLFIS